MRDLGPTGDVPPTLARLREVIEASGARTQDVARNLMPVVRDFGQHGLLAPVIEEILRDDRYLTDELLSRSYRHVLGFNKYVLLSGQPDYQVRLHVWDSDGPRQPEHVHNHRFSFASSVVLGRFSFQTFAKGAAGCEMNEFSEYLNPETLAWQLEEAGPSNAENQLDVTLEPGSAYSIDASVLHRVQPEGNSLTATLFVEGRSFRRTTSVLLPAGEDPPMVRERSPLTRRGCREQLNQILTRLG